MRAVHFECQHTYRIKMRLVRSSKDECVEKKLVVDSLCARACINKTKSRANFDQMVASLFDCVE